MASDEGPGKKKLRSRIISFLNNVAETKKKKKIKLKKIDSLSEKKLVL